MSSRYPSMIEAMLNKTDGFGWRSMECAPRVADDDAFEQRERILARTEHGEDLVVVYSIASPGGSGAWRRVESPETAIRGALIAWRPVPELGEPDARTIARSMAHHAAIGAEKAERMARFLPQEKERAERLRAEEKHHLEIANRKR
jgi:hypothetical protein